MRADQSTVIPPQALEAIPPFAAEYAPADEALVPRLLAETADDAGTEDRIAARARRYITGIREARGGNGGLEDFMHDYSLSTREGLALMSLAEALLRIDAGANRRAAGVIWEWVAPRTRAVVWPPALATHELVALPVQR